MNENPRFRGEPLKDIDQLELTEAASLIASPSRQLRWQALKTIIEWQMRDLEKEIHDIRDPMERNPFMQYAPVDLLVSELEAFKHAYRYLMREGEVNHLDEEDMWQAKH